jgi:hypothetical protein
MAGWLALASPAQVGAVCGFDESCIPFLEDCWGFCECVEDSGAYVECWSCLPYSTFGFLALVDITGFDNPPPGFYCPSMEICDSMLILDCNRKDG